jgi:hypothetical protein
MIINRQGLLTGSYRVDAAVSGDVVNLPRLVEGTFRPTRPVCQENRIGAGGYNTGQLKKLCLPARRLR